MKAREWKRVLAETLIIVALGLLVALAANQVSPRGLSLTRNYFPGNGQPPGNSTLDARMSQGSNANIGTSIKGANTNDSR